MPPRLSSGDDAAGSDGDETGHGDFHPTESTALLAHAHTPTAAAAAAAMPVTRASFSAVPPDHDAIGGPGDFADPRYSYDEFDSGAGAGAGDATPASATLGGAAASRSARAEAAALRRKYFNPTAVDRRNLSSSFNFSILYKSSTIAFMITLLFVGAFFVLRSISHHPDSTVVVDSPQVTWKISIVNTIYEEPESPLRSLKYLPWEAIVEPYQEHRASLLSFTVDDLTLTAEELLEDAGAGLESSRYHVRWTIEGLNDDRDSGSDDLVSEEENEKYTGPVISFFLNSTATGLRAGQVVLLDRSTGLRYVYPFTFALRYVRRELRSLTDEHRTRTLDALQLMYTMSQEEGEATYGPKYRSGEALLFRHLNGAGTTDCDHWHDGAGLITHHAAFTLEAEQSLQAIDPSLSMPYWEYPMDAYYYDQSNWFTSPIFDDDWFSEASPTNELHELRNGRWGYLKMPNGSSYLDWDIDATGSLNPFVNAYGYMRSPWNNNPSPYLSRHNETYGAFSRLGRPGCSSMSDCYSSPTLAEMNDCMNGYTHGPVHLVIGGAWGEGDLFDDPTSNIMFLQKASKLLLFKMLWRAGWSRCPISCETYETCLCAVPEEYISTYGATAILQSAGVLTAIEEELRRVEIDDLESFHMVLLKAIQSPGVAGEMFSSAAPWDPTFWPLHGSIERLLGLKRISKTKGMIAEEDFDETWGYKTNNYLYLVGRCDWSGVQSAADLTLPTCNISTDVICSGHQEDDVLEWTDLLNDGASYTNAEFYAAAHPWSEVLPYTYDSFDYDYCFDMYPTSSFKFDSIEYANPYTDDAPEPDPQPNLSPLPMPLPPSLPPSTSFEADPVAPSAASSSPYSLRASASLFSFLKEVEDAARQRRQ